MDVHAWLREHRTTNWFLLSELHITEQPIRTDVMSNRNDHFHDFRQSV